MKALLCAEHLKPNIGGISMLVDAVTILNGTALCESCVRSQSEG